MKLKTGDTIIVIAGKDRGKTGEIMRLLKKQDRIVVKGINLRIKHVKKTATRPGEKIQFEAPMHSSNVMILCQNCSKPTRIGHLIPESGKKQRTCKLCKQTVASEASNLSKNKKKK